MSSKGEWAVGDTLDTKDLNKKNYRSKYQCLQVGRRKWLEENCTAHMEQTIEELSRKLQEKKE